MENEFRAMRRNRQQLSESETLELLRGGTSGVLAVSGDGGYPYAVPLSYVYADGVIYFHSALEGHKIDAVRRLDKASFCVVCQDDVQPERYTTHFRSVIAFGRIRIVTDEDERMSAARLLGHRYHPHGTEAELEAELAHGLGRMHVLRFDIEHITGKESIELTRMR